MPSALLTLGAVGERGESLHFSAFHLLLLLQVTNISVKLPEVESFASEHVFRLYVDCKRSFLEVCPSNDIMDVSRTE